MPLFFRHATASGTARTGDVWSWVACLKSGPCSLTESSNLFDENCHLILLDSTGVVLVELLEAGFEVFLREFSTVGALHVAESLLDKGLGLILVESAGVVLVVLSPDVVNALLDDC